MTVMGIVCFIQKDETACGAGEALSDSEFLSFAGGSIKLRSITVT